jgi:polysaccharide export outer membrane protein
MLPKNNENNFKFFRAFFFLSFVLSGAVLESPVLAQSAPPQAAVSNETGDYLIGPGDTLNVFVWRQPELSSEVPVRPDGQISTPLVEDMMAVGKTPSELARDIESVLSEYIRDPQVTIIVEEFVGTFGAQIRVLGAIVNPGSVPYRERMTLLDVMLEVGGLTEFAAGNRSKLVRTTDGATDESRVRLDKLLNKGDLSENIAMRPGDVVVVPEAVF